MNNNKYMILHYLELLEKNILQKSQDLNDPELLKLKNLFFEEMKCEQLFEYPEKIEIYQFKIPTKLISFMNNEYLRNIIVSQNPVLFKYISEKIAKDNIYELLFYVIKHCPLKKIKVSDIYDTIIYNFLDTTNSFLIFARRLLKFTENIGEITNDDNVIELFNVLLTLKLNIDSYEYYNIYMEIKDNIFFKKYFFPRLPESERMNISIQDLNNFFNI